VFEGTYEYDKKQGYGEFHWASGNSYKGDFKDDERHGLGTMVWTDGSTYEGAWERGVQHGYGNMTFDDGTSKEGYFDNKIYVGKEMPMQRPKKVKIRKVLGKEKAGGSATI